MALSEVPDIRCRHLKEKKKLNCDTDCHRKHSAMLEEKKKRKRERELWGN